MSVYTVIEQAELEAFLADYNVGTLASYEGISAGIENTNYFVNTEKDGQLQQFVLTVFEHHTFDELPYFLNIMAFMAEHAIPTAHPEKSLSNGYLKSLQGKPAALVERLKGDGVELPTLKQCEVMGEQMAKFHLAGQDFEDFRENDRNLDWMQTTFDLIQPLLPQDEVALISEEINTLSNYEWEVLPQGVIHADLFCDNALFDGNELSGIIDLYYACNGSLLYDLAVMVNDWCRLPDLTYDDDKVAAMLSSYQQTRELTWQEKMTWPYALRLAALRFFLSRLKDKHMPREGEMTQIKDPNVFKSVLIYHQNHAAPL
ncbi:homoserine kinase [Hydrogenovibrio sp. JE_KL2]|uniref:homoserine kinase n=1 Tax=Hydrogenovibrio sp. JE_KL2 TaxID=2651188 RepID=UPI0013531948|nr:homoserine kinase [Hydrogenovibrio sp. JE_KL2]